MNETKTYLVNETFAVFMAFMHLAVECGLQSDLSDIALPTQAEAEAEAKASEPYIAILWHTMPA